MKVASMQHCNSNHQLASRISFKYRNLEQEESVLRYKSKVLYVRQVGEIAFGIFTKINCSVVPAKEYQSLMAEVQSKQLVYTPQFSKIEQWNSPPCLMGVSLGSYLCIFFGIILLLDNTALTFYFVPQKHKQMRLLQFSPKRCNNQK